MLSIHNLQVSTSDKTILHGIDLTIEPGKVYAIMGPNGSGKSTLSHVLAGKPGYEIDAGDVQFQSQDLLEMSPEERVAAGLFLAFQYPVSIAGVSNLHFLKTAVNATRKLRGQEPIDAIDIIKRARALVKDMGLDESFLKRSVNDEFSGGEKKRNEMVQMLMLEPSLVILDEIDSGLDVDALRIIADTVNAMRSPERSILMITHYQRLLTHIKPDVVCVLRDGRVVAQGGLELAETIEEKGYAWLDGEDQNDGSVS